MLISFAPRKSSFTKFTASSHKPKTVKSITLFTQIGSKAVLQRGVQAVSSSVEFVKNVLENMLKWRHYSDVIMGTMASQITSLTIVYSTIYSGADQRQYQSSVSLAFVRGIHRWLVNSPHKGPVTRKRFPFDDVIMSIFQTFRITCTMDCIISTALINFLNWSILILISFELI